MLRQLERLAARPNGPVAATVLAVVIALGACGDRSLPPSGDGNADAAVPATCCWDATSRAEVPSCIGRSQCVCSAELCTPATACRPTGVCPVPDIPCLKCDDGTTACPQADCVRGHCLVTIPGCAPQCRADGDCPVPGACPQCPDGSCADYIARCTNGRCEGGFVPCGGGGGVCARDSDCPEPPPFCQTCADGTQVCPRATCSGGVCGIELPVCPPPQPQCKADADCPPVKAPCQVCPDGSPSCPISRCANGVCDVYWPACPAERCGKVICANGTVCCNASCSICVPPQGGCIDLACNRTPVASPCVRSSGDACGNDADCRPAGCGGELCHNPALTPGVSDCNCPAPQNLGCGCINGRCTWWK